MVNISQIEFSKIPVPNLEGNVFTNVNAVCLKDTDDKAVPLKLTGKEQFLVLAFFSFTSLSKEDEFVRYFEEKKPDFTGLGANVMMVSVDTVAELKQFKENSCYSVTMLSDADQVLMKMLGTISETNR